MSDYYHSIVRRNPIGKIHLARIDGKSRSIIFCRGIDDRERHESIIQARVLNAYEKRWRIVDKRDMIDSEHAGRVTRYTYVRGVSRERFVTLMTIAFLVLLFLLVFGGVLLLPLSFVLVCIIIYSFLSFFRSAIVIDEDGITQATAFGKKTMRWYDLRAIRVAGENYMLEGAQKEVIEFSASISEFAYLIQDIGSPPTRPRRQ